jgi:putative hydrolase of the HAD superfamily
MLRGMLRAILFDLDGTLHDRAHTVRSLFEAQHRQFEAELRSVPREEYVRRMLVLDNYGYREKTEAFGELASELGLDAALAPVLAAHFFDTYAGHVRAFPEVLHVLSALRGRGLKLGIVTNGRQSVQQQKIDRLGLAALVDTVSISEAEGLKKPHPQIFQRALERLGVPARDAMYVGDHPVIDVKGAVDAGLSAAWRRTPAWPPPEVCHHPLDTLEELLALI